MKKILAISALFFLLILPSVSEVKLPSYSGFINDYAGILSSSQKQELNSISQGLKQKTGAELVVAIVESVEPLDSKLYAVKLFEKWGIGEKGKDNGVLILLAMKEKRIEIEVGYGLEGKLTDSVCGRILDDYAVPNFKEGNFGKGLIETAKAISNIVAGEEAPPASKPAEEKDELGIYFFVLIIAIIILGILFKRAGSIFMGLFGIFWGASYGAMGMIFGAIIGFLFGFWGLWFLGSGGGRGFGGGFSGGFGGGGGGGFGGGRSGGGGAGRGW